MQKNKQTNLNQIKQSNPKQASNKHPCPNHHKANNITSSKDTRKQLKGQHKPKVIMHNQKQKNQIPNAKPQVTIKETNQILQTSQKQSSKH